MRNALFATNDTSIYCASIQMDVNFALLAFYSESTNIFYHIMPICPGDSEKRNADSVISDELEEIILLMRFLIIEQYFIVFKHKFSNYKN